MRETNYLLVVEDRKSGKVTTTGYRTKKEAIKGVRAERVKYKSDKSYKGDWSGNGECFTTNDVEVTIKKTSDLVYGIGLQIYVVGLWTDDGYSTERVFGKRKDAERFFDATVKMLLGISTEISNKLGVMTFKGESGRQVKLELRDWTYGRWRKYIYPLSAEQLEEDIDNTFYNWTLDNLEIFEKGKPISDIVYVEDFMRPCAERLCVVDESDE